MDYHATIDNHRRAFSPNTDNCGFKDHHLAQWQGPDWDLNVVEKNTVKTHNFFMFSLVLRWCKDARSLFSPMSTFSPKGFEFSAFFSCVFSVDVLGSRVFCSIRQRTTLCGCGVQHSWQRLLTKVEGRGLHQHIPKCIISCASCCFWVVFVTLGYFRGWIIPNCLSLLCFNVFGWSAKMFLQLQVTYGWLWRISD